MKQDIYQLVAGPRALRTPEVAERKSEMGWQGNSNGVETGKNVL